MLVASEALLHKVDASSDQFNHGAWLETAAVCALHLGQFDLAIARFNEALTALPEDWMARRVFVTIGLAGALASRGDREATLITVRETIPRLKVLQAQELNQHFRDSLAKLIVWFPDEPEFRDFVAAPGSGALTDD